MKRIGKVCFQFYFVFFFLILVFLLVFVVGYKVAWNYNDLILELRLDFIHDFEPSVFRL